MGIGDWAQSPIPNPQSPIKIKYYKIHLIFKLIILIILLNNYFFIKNKINNIYK